MEMKIGSVNVDSLLLVFHISKVAYSNSVLRLFYVPVLCFVGTYDCVPTFRQRRREIEERNERTLFSLVEALRVPRALDMKNAWISPALEINSLIGQMRKKQSEEIWILDVSFQMLTNVPDLKFMSVNNSATTQLEGDSNPLITLNRRFTWKWGYLSNLAFVQARLLRQTLKF